MQRAQTVLPWQKIFPGWWPKTLVQSHFAQQKGWNRLLERLSGRVQEKAPEEWLQQEIGGHRSGSRGLGKSIAHCERG